jgi:hypothetical protein
MTALAAIMMGEKNESIKMYSFVFNIGYLYFFSTRKPVTESRTTTDIYFLSGI